MSGTPYTGSSEGHLSDLMLTEGRLERGALSARWLYAHLGGKWKQLPWLSAGRGVDQSPGRSHAVLPISLPCCPKGRATSPAGGLQPCWYKSQD